MTPTEEATFIALWQARAADVPTHLRKHVLTD
jgi:hypothetical protein